MLVLSAPSHRFLLTMNGRQAGEAFRCQATAGVHCYSPHHPHPVGVRAVQCADVSLADLLLFQIGA
jgi:hypothetical protein